jgi:hypothetical protein
MARSCLQHQHSLKPYLSCGCCRASSPPAPAASGRRTLCPLHAQTAQVHIAHLRHILL